MSDDKIIQLNHIFSSSTFLDDDIKSEIKSLYQEFGSIFDPHSVTSIRMALNNQDSVPTVAVATASPEKFSNVIAPLIETFSEVEIDDKEEYLKLENDKFAISESIKAYFS